MLEAVGHPVIKLVRVRMGPLSLGDLAPGEFRFLTDREANALREMVEHRVSSVERGERAAAYPKRMPRRAGWAKPERARKSSAKKAKVA
jgi:23S rRNA pseudouridine2605 synthase